VTIPVLTPLDSPIFDDDVVADLEANQADEVACETCSEAAEVRIVLRCCRTHVLFGPRCHAIALQSVARDIAFGLLLVCEECGHEFDQFCSVRDVVEEIPL
jgi:hypothetical protein